MLTQDQIKEKIGIHAADYIKPGMKVGLGTGSTVFYLLKELGRRKAQGLHFTAVCTSVQTQRVLIEEGIEFLTLDEVDRLQIAIDGADEIDPAGNMIKGGGGALLREKIVEYNADELIIIIDEKKRVNNLGAFPLPVEVVTFGWKQVRQKLANDYGIIVLRREHVSKPFITDQGNYILDCHFSLITDPQQLNTDIQLIPGVVETGLFVGMADKAITGYADGSIEFIEF